MFTDCFIVNRYDILERFLRDQMSLNVTLKMEAAGFSETLVTDYQITRRNISEDSSIRKQFCTNLKTTIR